MIIEPNKEQKKRVKKHLDFDDGHQIGTENEQKKIAFSLLWLPNMDPFNTAPDFILDLIFLKLNEEDLHETLRVSKSWFWASIRRTKKLKITKWCNPLESIAVVYNNHRPPNEKIDCLDLFKHLVLDELVVIRDTETTQYLVNNGCNTAELTIETSGEEEVPVTLASLKTITRLQSFEYCTKWGTKWHPFIVECMKSSDCEFDPNTKCPIAAIKLKSSKWNSKYPVLKSVTKLTVCKVTIDFLRTMVDHCPNLEEFHCTLGRITQEWRQVFPANVKRIELQYFTVDDDVARVVNASTDAGRQLLPYLCQNWEAVEKFHFDYFIHDCGNTVYEAFPQQREEVFVCRKYNEEMNLGGSLFQSREIGVGRQSWNALELIIPSTKSVKLEFVFGCDSKFSARDACLEPREVECFSFTLRSWNRVTLEPFVPNSFEGFTRLNSLTLSHVSASSIKMVLDQCPSIRKIELQYLKAFTIGSMSNGSSYANVNELVLKECEETMQGVFQVFPRLSEFKYSHFFEVQQRRKKKADCLWRHLIEEGKRYGVVFENSFENWYLVSDDLQASLSQAQKILNEHNVGESVCYLKGFKLIPRFAKQKVIYILKIN